MPKYTRYSGEEWSALYDEQGDLITYGDHYIVYDKLAEILEVEDIQSEDFLTPDGHSVHQKLSDISKDPNQVRIAELEAEVERLRQASGLGWRI